MKRVLLLLSIVATSAILIINTTIPLAQAQVAAGPRRPADVPEGYVITPFGYFHPSCVRRLAEGETVLTDGRVKHADGTMDISNVACKYPHYTAAGEIVNESGTKGEAPSIGHSWVEYASTTTGQSFGEITANWIVPPSPVAFDGQTVFLFPGLQDINDLVSIIQPVLGWNADFSKAWGIASWNCCPGGTANESAPVHVNSGDIILGTVKSTCSAGTLSCPTWNITTADQTTGQSTTLSNTPSENQTFNWASPGVLEVYSIAQCSDYPPNGWLVFSNVGLYDYNFVQISNPAWSKTFAAGLTPACNYNVKTAATQAAVVYGVPCAVLIAGQELTAGTSFPSCDGRFTLDMQTDNNLVLYMGNTALWATSTVGSGAAYVVMQGDGNLVLYTGSGVAVWNSGTSGHPGAYMAVQNDGNLVVYSPSHVILWNSQTSGHVISGPTQCGIMTGGQGLSPGKTQTSCDGRFMLKMQTDGNLVLYEGSTALWNTQTSGAGGYEAIMQGDGNFVLYSSTYAIWASNTSGNPGADIDVQPDGNLVVYNTSHQALWQSGTCCH